MGQDPFLGSVRLYPFNFAPSGWAACQGQLLPISQNAALFSLLGTFYGGNGTSTFALPNLQGCVPIGMGQGTGLSNYTMGETAGAPTVTLIATQLPAHTHPLNSLSTKGAASAPTGAYPAGSLSSGFPVVAKDKLYSSAAPNATMNAQTIAAAGAGGAHNNLQSYLAMGYYIALVGIFPTRN